MTLRRCEPAGVAALAVTLAMALGTSASVARAQGFILNPGFEQGMPGEVPAGWTSAFRSYAVELVADGAHGGKQAVRMVGSQVTPGEFGNLMQWIDAKPLRGKRVRYSGFVRAESMSGGSAGLWLRVDRPGGAQGFFDNMQDRPIVAAEWKRYTIVGTVAPDAEKIYFGLLLAGVGRVWLDDVSLEALPPGPPPEPARALSPRGLVNLVAFTRLLGYVRFFHPSDESAAADWNALAVAGVRTAERAPTPARLAAVLDSLFRPVAPSLVVTAGAPSAGRTASAPPKGATQAVAWRHVGVGLAPGSAYHSERMRFVLDGAALPDSFADPFKPFVADLGGGVRALVPLTVFADEKGTLPRAAAPLHASDAERLPPGAYNADDRAVRLADVALAWPVFQHFYPYFDVTGTDWSAELPRALGAAASDRDASAFTRTLQRMVAALKDGHGGVYGAAGSPRIWSPPVLLRPAEGDRVVVLRAGEGQPQLRQGDVVLAVDGVSIADALARDEELISAATPQWRRWRALSELLLGSKDTPLRVEVLHPDRTRETVSLTRSVPVSSLKEKRPEVVAEVRPGIWYLDLDRLTDAQFAEMLPKLVGARGLIFDMRGYPRSSTPALLAHLSKTPMTSAQWHIPVAIRPDREGVRFQRGGEWDVQPIEPYLAAPRVWLLDGRAISYAESTMGIVENYHLGEIVGGTSAGTNGNVNPLQLPGGFTIAWTGMKVLKHDGSRHHGVGIAPTIPVPLTVAGVAAGKDEQLEKAIQILDH